MREIVFVGVGSCFGGVARYLLSSWTLHLFAFTRFPVGTFVVNILGCLLIGVVAGVFETRQSVSPDLKLFLMTGVLGGFTTFSAFGLETLMLLRSGAVAVAAMNILLSCVLCLLAVLLGTRIASFL